MTHPDNIISHPTLGCSLRGKASNASVQFRNLKYASIPARYKDSVPNNELKLGKDGVFDATKFGPSCPQKRGGQAFDLTLIGEVTLPCEEGQGDTEVMNEFECLHVNITVPRSALRSASGDGQALPVFVWIHGGGLSIGSNSWPQYDLQRFVDRSVEIGMPVIAVAVNYRVGLHGFIASKELGATGNMGLKDQILAFRWVKKHIAGFGGDEANITAAGESAGAIALSTLMCANVGAEGLFERVILMSGEVTLRKPRSRWWQERMYTQQATALGVSEAELKTKCLDTDAIELAQQSPLTAHWCPNHDGKFLGCQPNLYDLANGKRPVHKPTWCKEFLVGDTQHDGTILKSRILDHPRAMASLRDACANHVTEEGTSRLFAAYNLDEPSSAEEEKEKLLALVSEIRFYLPAICAHRGWLSTTPPRIAHRYHFHTPNPFPGAYTGLSSHELDVAFLLQNYNDHLDAQNVQIAKDMADRFIGLVNGEGWCEKGKVVVFEKDGVKEVDVGEYDRVWRGKRGEILESIGKAMMWRMVEMWQGVMSEEEEQKRGKGVEA